MKPYRLEVFDRNFNFRATALIDPRNYTCKYDYLTREQNTVVVPDSITIRVNSATGTAGDNTVCTGDYLIIDDDLKRTRRSGTTYAPNTWVIVKVENVEGGVEITYTDPLILFNHEIYAAVDDIKEKSSDIEQLIADLISQEFINTTDLSQKIPGLQYSREVTEITGYFEFADTDDYYVTFNLLNDVILPSFSNYLVATIVDINIWAKTVDVQLKYHIGIEPLTIEDELPNVLNSNYIIKQTGADVNKVTIIDTAEENAKYNYYLHATDYTYSDVDTDRITPVMNAIKMVNGDAITEERFWYRETEALKTLQKYIEYNGNLSAQILVEIQRAFEVVYPYFKAIMDPTLTAAWYKNNVEFKNICQGSSIHYPIFDFALYDSRGRQMWATYKDISWDDTDSLKGGSYYTFRVSQRKSSIAKTDFEYRGQYKGTLPSDVSVPMPTDHISRFVTADTATPDEVKSVVTYAEEILWWRKDGRKISYFQFTDIGGGNWQVTETSFTQTVNSDFSHIHLKLPYTVDVRGNIYDSDTQTNDINTFYDISGYVNIPVTYSMISSYLNSYKQTAAYQEAFAAYKAAQISFIMDGYVGKNFAAAKYVNNIELVVLQDDALIDPVNLAIGRRITVIHGGNTYESILTGKEYMTGKRIKLVLGMIRTDLTKILRLKGV